MKVDLGPFLKDDFKKVHAYMVSHNLDTRDLYHVTVYDRDGTMEVDVDYQKLKVVVDMERLKDFSLTIYADRAIMSTVEEAIKKDKFFFKRNALQLCSLMLKEKRLLFLFMLSRTRAAMESYSFETALRVMTIMEPGYIGLVPEERSSWKWL